MEQLGTMSLREKIEKIGEEKDDEVAAGHALLQAMTPAEKSRSWSRHQTHLNKRGHEEEEAAFQALGKREKGLQTAVWLMKQNTPRYFNVQQEVKASQELTKKEKWYSEKEALDKWGESDLWKHCDSGRIRWRECSTSAGVYEYTDTMDFTKKIRGTKATSWTEGQEYGEHDAEEEEWDRLLGKDLHSLMLEGSLAKGGGKGKASVKGGKGKDKGKPNSTEEEQKGKANKGLLALLDMPAEQQMEEGAKKMKKLKETLHTQSGHLQEKMDLVEQMDYFTKGAWAEKKAMQKTLEKMQQKVKKIFNQGEKASLDDIKTCLQEGVALMKNVREELKGVGSHQPEDFLQGWQVRVLLTFAKRTSLPLVKGHFVARLAASLGTLTERASLEPATTLAKGLAGILAFFSFF